MVNFCFFLPRHTTEYAFLSSVLANVRVISNMAAFGGGHYLSLFPSEKKQCKNIRAHTEVFVHALIVFSSNALPLLLVLTISRKLAGLSYSPALIMENKRNTSKMNAKWEKGAPACVPTRVDCPVICIQIDMTA